MLLSVFYIFFFFQAEDGIRDAQESRGLGDVYKRQMRDPFIMKSNYISYATHASWQQEIWAAVERSRKHLSLIHI